MAVYRAYYDASGVETQDGHLVLVGVVAREQKWEKFEKLWDSVLSSYQLTHHHHKHYVHSRGEFTGWASNEPKRMAYLATLIKCLKLGMNKAYVAAVANASIEDVNRHYEFGKGDGSGAYLLVADTCRKWVERWVHTKYPGSSIHHVFEEGDRGQELLPALLSLSGRNNGSSILPKKNDLGQRLRGFEGADLVAWEAKRIMDDIRNGRRRGVRGSLRAISKMLPMAGAEITKERLLEICNGAPQFFAPRASPNGASVSDA